jgi:hypothetical protein
MEDFFQDKDPSIAKRFVRLLADPVESLFFQKIEKGEIDQELNAKLYELFTKER